jgi:predicted nucleic acid-binding protein
LITAVDTNIILDVLVRDPQFADSSGELLATAWTEGSLVVCAPVYAELGAFFPDRVQLDRFLSETGVRLDLLGRDALYLAGRAWREYGRRRPDGMICTACGERNTVECVRCRNLMRQRQHLITDFIIGAHASTQSDRLLTRDAGYYRTYFPSLALQ